MNTFDQRFPELYQLFSSRKFPNKCYIQIYPSVDLIEATEYTFSEKKLKQEIIWRDISIPGDNYKVSYQYYTFEHGFMWVSKDSREDDHGFDCLFRRGEVSYNNRLLAMIKRPEKDWSYNLPTSMIYLFSYSPHHTAIFRAGEYHFYDNERNEWTYNLPLPEEVQEILQLD
jgi:hypothetical protein